MEKSKPFKLQIHYKARGAGKIYDQAFAAIKKSMSEGKNHIEITYCEWDRVTKLLDIIRIQREALKTLSVAVNDKVEDKGATNFCLKTLAATEKLLAEIGCGDE